jgi:hypothetical protein
MSSATMRASKKEKIRPSRDICLVENNIHKIARPSRSLFESPHLGVMHGSAYTATIRR